MGSPANVNQPAPGSGAEDGSTGDDVGARALGRRR